MTSIATWYMGLELNSPVVCSSSPLCRTMEKLWHMQECGAGAVVLHSLFAEQVEQESWGLHNHTLSGEESHAEATDYFPELQHNSRGPDDYIEYVRAARHTLRIPLIASLNGTGIGSWLQYARAIERAGASALELNIYNLPCDPDKTAMDVEEEYIELVKAVRSEIRIPLAVKLGPQFSSPLNFARRLADSGADALVLFNRFYQPDLDIDSLDVIPRLRLSAPDELLLRLRWTALMYGRVNANLAITGGVHTFEDVIKCMMAGADVAMTTSALILRGVEHLRMLHSGLIAWMEERDYTDIEMMRGSLSHATSPSPGELERANYLQVLGSYAVPDGWR